ncbi:MAG: cell division protein FtsZ [Chloroflexota bacterium]
MNTTTSSNLFPMPQDGQDAEAHALGVRQPVLKVVGLGGGGCNAIERMMALEMKGVEFIAANTDVQVLKNHPAPVRILLGPKTTEGMGAGGNPERGRAAAEESRQELSDALAGADMIFLTAGMGGGTGTGSIPVAAEIARAQGAVTIAIVTTPFSFEMGRRQKNASEGLARLREHTHTLVTIPNDRLIHVAPRNLSMQLAFHLADDVLRQAVQGITELVTTSGLINVDFAHIRRLIQLGGGALMSIGQADGENKARQALQQALHHPLLDSVDLSRAAGVIANFTGGQDLTLFEVQDALTSLQARTGEDTEIIFGVITDDSMEGRAQVILMITGLGAVPADEIFPGLKQPARRPEPALAPAARPASAGREAGESAHPYYPPPAFHTGAPDEAPAAPRALNLAPAARDLPPFFRYRSNPDWRSR